MEILSVRAGSLLAGSAVGSWCARTVLAQLWTPAAHQDVAWEKEQKEVRRGQVIM